MGSFDKIVRPFQIPIIGPAPVPPTSSNESEQSNTKIICGENGGAKTFSGTIELTISYYAIRKPKEKKQQQQS